MIKNIIILIAFIFTVCFSSCYKKISQDNITTVKGFVIDTIKNKRLANATVKINNCYYNYGYFKVFCNDSLTSIITDKNGEFELKFRSEGEPIAFEASVVTDENFDKSNQVPLKGGDINTIRLKAEEKNFLKTNIKINNNPFENLLVLINGSRKIIYGQNKDTLIYFRVFPNSENHIRFVAYDKTIEKYRSLDKVIKTDLSDTTYYSIDLPDVKTFPTN